MIERKLVASYNHENLQGRGLLITNEAGETLPLNGVLEVTTFADGFCIILAHKFEPTGELIMDAESGTPVIVFSMGQCTVKVIPHEADFLSDVPLTPSPNVV